MHSRKTGRLNAGMLICFSHYAGFSLAAPALTLHLFSPGVSFSGYPKELGPIVEGEREVGGSKAGYTSGVCLLGPALQLCASVSSS